MLYEMEFLFDGGDVVFPTQWSHTGIVSSGDMEVLINRADDDELKHKVKVKVVTPLRGYDDVWQKVLNKFVSESGITGVIIEINDNNATPFIVGMRLKQALIEATSEE